MAEQTINKIIEDKDLLMMYGQDLGDIAENNIGKIIVFEITKNNLIQDCILNETDVLFDDRIKEVGRVQYCDWEALKSIIGETDSILEKEESLNYKSDLINYGSCDGCDKICECHDIGRTILNCEGNYIYSGTAHYKSFV